MYWTISIFSLYFVISFSVHNPFWYAETQGIKTKSSTAFDYITSVYEQKYQI